LFPPRQPPSLPTPFQPFMWKEKVGLLHVFSDCLLNTDGFFLSPLMNIRIRPSPPPFPLFVLPVRIDRLSSSWPFLRYPCSTTLPRSPPAGFQFFFSSLACKIANSLPSRLPFGLPHSRSSSYFFIRAPSCRLLSACFYFPSSSLKRGGNLQSFIDLDDFYQIQSQNKLYSMSWQTSPELCVAIRIPPYFASLFRLNLQYGPPSVNPTPLSCGLPPIL